jgi:hypothetical protein
MTGRAEKIVLVAILAFAAAVRFAGIGHHLAHDPMDFDEMNNFVDPILKMWRTGSPDPTVYSGYPGFFNWLAFVPVVLGHTLAGQYGAFVGGRALVAAFGVVNVFLTHRVSRAFVGSVASLAGAGLMAVSRGEVHAAHKITPDVLVTTALLVILLLLRVSRGVRGWIVAGIACGLATAVKYTGLLTAPAVVVGLALGADRRRSLPITTAAALLTFATAAPYAVAAASSVGMGMGFDHSLQHYYGDEKVGNLALQGRGLAVDSVADFFVRDLGWPGIALAVVGFVFFVPRRELLPAAAVVAAAILVMAPANKVYARHALPATGAAIVLAAVGFAAVIERLPGLRGPWRRQAACALLALVLLGPPGLAAARTAAIYRGPTAADRAIAWVEANVPSPGLVASAIEPFSPDPRRFEVRGPLALETIPAEARAQYDLLVARGPAPGGFDDLTVAAELCEGPRPAGCEITLLRPLQRPLLAAAPAPLAVLASERSDEALAALDGNPATSWRAPAGAGWLALRWSTPQAVARVEVDVDRREGSWPQVIDWEGVVDGHRQVVAAEGLRPVRVRRQRPGAPRGQIFALTPTRSMTELRLVRPSGTEWGVAEIRVFVRSP